MTIHIGMGDRDSVGVPPRDAGPPDGPTDAERERLAADPKVAAFLSGHPED